MNATILSLCQKTPVYEKCKQCHATESVNYVMLSII